MHATLTRRSLIAAGAAGLLARPAVAQRSTAPPEVLATYPTGTFLENLEAMADGSVLFTSYFDRRILRWTPQGVTVFAELDVHPVDFVTLPDGMLVAAHATPLTAGPAFVTSMRIVRLGADGRARESRAAPHARFLNGAILAPDGRMLIADSLAGVIWAYSEVGGRLEPIWSDDALLPVNARPGEFALGANGIKLAGGHLYVSNSSTASLLRVRFADGAPAGAVETVARFSGIDDFAIAADGRIFVATHRTDVVMREAGGRTTVLIAERAEGATAVAIGRGPSAGFLFVTTTGGLFAGLRENANLLRIPLPAR